MGAAHTRERGAHLKRLAQQGWEIRASYSHRSINGALHTPPSGPIDAELWRTKVGSSWILGKELQTTQQYLRSPSWAPPQHLQNSGMPPRLSLGIHLWFSNVLFLIAFSNWIKKKKANLRIGLFSPHFPHHSRHRRSQIRLHSILDRCCDRSGWRVLAIPLKHVRTLCGIPKCETQAATHVQPG